MSVFDLATFVPSLQDIAYSASKMPPAPAHKIQGMRIVQRHTRSMRADQVPPTMPNMSLEEQPAPEEVIVDVLRLERHVYSGNRRRAKDLARLQPTSSKPTRLGLNPTHRGGTPIIQPGGHEGRSQFRGN